jgi:hypothetical protein
VTLALTRLGRELHGKNRDQVLEEIYGETKERA